MIKKHKVVAVLVCSPWPDLHVRCLKGAAGTNSGPLTSLPTFECISLKNYFNFFVIYIVGIFLSLGVICVYVYIYTSVFYKLFLNKNKSFTYCTMSYFLFLTCFWSIRTKNSEVKLFMSRNKYNMWFKKMVIA